MNSLVYFYSKFTEEFLLLGAAGVFSLLSIYCYHWVIQKRRLGVARYQIPSTVVKSYLSQLINEAEFVRKQLFGMTDGNTYAPIPPGTTFTSPSAEGNHTVSPDLMARVNALEAQLKEKEGLVVNINIEKTKLLDEIEKLKANPKGASAGAAAGNQDLTQKIKNLEERLEEYALFEEDLANLKRLQQENTQLKKKLGDLGSNLESATVIPASPKEEPTERKILSAVPDLEKEIPAPKPAEESKHALDRDAIDSLLNGTPATPPETQPAVDMPEFVETPAAEVPVPSAPAPTPIAAAAPVASTEPVSTPQAPSAPTDQFEKLVDSVETSLEVPTAKMDAAPTESTPPAASKQAAAPTTTPDAQAPATESPLANKTDEELLKEFENLLNS